MVDVVRLSEVAVVTGEDSPNRTGSGFGVYGTDLGILWDSGNGEVLAAFGDTYGLGWAPPGTGPDHADWRCNVLAASTATDLAAGLPLYPVATRPNGTAAQILDRDRDVRENTVIPTTGIAVDGTDYLHYMSVRNWGKPGNWDTTYAGVAVSTDHGRTWRKPPGSRWPNRRHRHPFQMGAFVRDGEHVYLVGTPAGRFGSASLARVPAPSVSDVDAYEYWTGRAWVRGDPFAAVPVLAGPVGELSVGYHRFLGRWLAIHLDEHRAAIVLRSAERLTGPWRDPVPLVSGTDYPGLYGGYLHPWTLDGPDVYFTMSQWVPYHVLLLRATLAGG